MVKGSPVMKIEEKNKRDFNLKKLLNDQEYLENLTDPMFERIKDKINDLYVTEEKKNKYKIIDSNNDIELNKVIILEKVNRLLR